MRSLRADGPNGWTIVMVVAVTLLIGWSGWFAMGRVDLYETTADARLEVSRAAHPAASLVSGRVAAARLSVGRVVRAGEVVVELDAEAERLALEEGRARLVDLRARLVAAEVELAAERAAARSRRGAGAAAEAEAEARAQEAGARAALASDEAGRLEALAESGGVAELELSRKRTEATAAAASARALVLAGRRLAAESELAAGDRAARIAGLDGEAVELKGRIEIETAAVRRLERAMEERRIRAPLDGILAEVAELEVGSVVEAGERVAFVVPPGGLRAVALFPASSLGRIRKGQTARLRLDGYPWTRFGAVAASVVAVGGHPRDGRFRVEMALTPGPTTIPLEHGLSGTAEILVERISPAALVLRRAGALLGSRPPT